jgi:hypothetical protein
VLGGLRHPFQRERLRYDPSFHAEIAYCYEHGIPHSEFLEWLNEDRAKALAFMLEKASRCEMCGTADWEWAENQHAYEPVERFCMGCYLKHMANEDNKSLPGTTIVMRASKSPPKKKRGRRRG